jgi:hypothetical protein
MNKFKKKICQPAGCNTSANGQEEEQRSFRIHDWYKQIKSARFGPKYVEPFGDAPTQLQRSVELSGEERFQTHP